MIPVVTTAEMRRIDEQAIQGDVATGFSYMQKAGMGLYDTVSQMGLSRNSDEIAIVCGKGNNGGDGYVVGRLLLDKGYYVMCFGLCEGESLTGEARRAFNEYIAKEGNYFHIDDAADLEGFGRYSLIIDALLGTGVQGNPRGLFAEVIKVINLSGKPVVAVDTPSGLNNDTGQPAHPAVKADYTVTMGYPKIGQLFYPGRSLIGKLVIKDLGYPLEIAERNSSGLYLPAQGDFEKLVPPRKPAGSKFDHGLVCMLCGSRGMTGSAELAAMAALRSGCGMVHCAVPESIVPVLSAKVTEPVLHAFAETPEGSLASSNSDALLQLASSMQAALIGPGISHSSDTSKLVRELLVTISIPVVLDADGINAFKGYTKKLKKHAHDVILTPHKKEWERLFDLPPSEPAALINTIAQKAQEFSMTVIFKGNPSIVASPVGKVVVLPVGNSGMATAGSGDVLSGIVVSLMAQGCTPFDAAVLGTAIHGFSGEIASKAVGEYSVIASDLTNNIPAVFNTFTLQESNGILFE